MKIRKCITTGAFFLLALSLQNQAKAEPSESFKYLMKEQASLLDLGCMRIQHDLEVSGLNPAVVYYDFAINKIRVVVPVDSSLVEKQKLKGSAERITGIVKNKISLLFSQPISHPFEHNGFRDATAPPGLKNELMNNIEVIVRLTSTGKNVEFFSECATSLRSDEIYCKD